MKKNSVKVIAIALFVILAIVAIVPAAFAAADDTKYLIGYDNVNEHSVTNGASDASGAAYSVNRIIGSALTVVQVVGSGVAVIMLIVLAIKYISAAPSDKAEIKKHAVVYVVGAVVLFAASGIIGIVRRFASQNVVADE